MHIKRLMRVCGVMPILGRKSCFVFFCVMLASTWTGCSGAEVSGPGQGGPVNNVDVILPVDAGTLTEDASKGDPAEDSSTGISKDTSSVKPGGENLDGVVTKPDPDVVEEPCPVAGGLLCPCQDNADCDSGWCVEGPDGNVCTQECISDCPEGFVCRQMAGSDDDVIFLCVYPYTRLCRPCTADSECSANGGTLGDRCVDNGAGGQSCGVACSDDIKCPDEYLCAQVLTVTGAVSSQCVPSSGECPCTESLEGQAMVCSSASEQSSCKGERICEEGAWSVCTAPEEAAPSCDGLDNDCDGEVDEEGEVPLVDLISCGEGVCAHQVPACVDGAAGFCDPFEGKEAELCDSLDNDCDGMTDESWPEIGEACDVHLGEPDF